MGLTTSKGLSLFPDTQTSPPTGSGQTLMSVDMGSGTWGWTPKTVVAGTGITATEDATSITLAATGGGVPSSAMSGDLLSWNGSSWVGSSVSFLGLATTAAVNAARYTPGAPVAVSTPAFGTAYQGVDPTKPCFVSASVQTVYTLTIATTLNDQVNLVIGPTSAVASGTGIVIQQFRSSLTGIVASIGMGSSQMSPLSCQLPVGWYWALVRAAGSAATIQSAWTQTLLT